MTIAKKRAAEYREAIDSVKQRHPTAVCNQIVKALTVFYVVRCRPKGKIIASSTSARGAWMMASKVFG